MTLLTKCFRLEGLSGFSVFRGGKDSGMWPALTRCFISRAGFSYFS